MYETKPCDLVFGSWKTVFILLYSMAMNDILQHLDVFDISCSNQAECEELQKRVESLGSENRSLRGASESI